MYMMNDISIVMKSDISLHRMSRELLMRQTDMHVPLVRLGCVLQPVDLEQQIS